MNAPAFDGEFRRGDRGRTRAGEKYEVLAVLRKPLADDTTLVVRVGGDLWSYHADGSNPLGSPSADDLLPPTKPRKPKPATSEALKLAERMLAHVLAPVSIGFDAAGQEPARAPAAEPAKVALPWSDMLGEEYGSAGFRVSVDETDVAGTTAVKLEIQHREPAWLPSKDARRLAAALLAAADAAEAPAPAPAEPPAPLVLRVGGAYRTRGGKRADINAHVKGTSHPWRGYTESDDGAMWTDEGLWSYGFKNHLDLIAEWPDTGATS